MNLKEQLYVCTLAETGNITQAAKLLFISQPALSLYISNLENILGIRLFERIGKSFVLTQAGELYVEKAPFSVVVLGKFRRFLLVIFLSLFLHLDFSFIYSKFSMPFWGFFY